MKTTSFWAALLAAVLLTSTTSTTTNGAALPATWQALPFYADSNWPGPTGALAEISTDEVLLQGQPARTIESFAGRRKIRFKVFVEQRSADDGSFDFFLLPTGESTNLFPNPFTEFRVIYRNPGAYTGQDGLTVASEGGLLLGEIPFHVEAGKAYRVVVNVSAAGQLKIKIGGRALHLPATLVVPYPEFQIQISGWQPTNRWHVKNFRVR